MESYYTISEFAKKAGVSLKTLRHYQKEGLFTPSYIKENGYRYYTEQDILKVQRILALKYMGLSLDDIRKLPPREEGSCLTESLKVQKELLSKKISNMQNVAKAIGKIQDVLETDSEVDWPQVINLIKVLSMEDNLLQQYRDSTHINARIGLHNRYSTAEKNWYGWLYDFYHIEGTEKLLELGCGNGELWLVNHERLPKGFMPVLSDISMGMLNDASRKLENKVTAEYELIDCCKIPYEDNSMDVIVANHLLFYAGDLKQALTEINRVLKPGGILYCTAYGKEHMKEIEQLVKSYDPRIALSDINLYEIFGIENGLDILNEYFREVSFFQHEDALLVDNYLPVYDYIMSCHGNQEAIIEEKGDRFLRYLKEFMKKNKVFRIQKQAGIFVCKNNE